MYPKRMKHPNHGWHHAYNPNEEAYLRSIGWGDDVPEPVDPVELPLEPDLGQHTLESARAKLDALDIAYDKRFGLARLLGLLP